MTLVCARCFWVFLLVVSFNLPRAYCAEGKLLATAGLTQLEGSGGGGLVPWATLIGYDSRDEVAASIYTTSVALDDYRLYAWGVGVGLYDRVEFSLTRHTFDLSTLGGQIEQNIMGAKVRLYGDVVYSRWPQISLGVQHKRLLDGTIASALGAQNSHKGTDVYISASKVHLGLIGGYNLIWNVTGRLTKANELGLLGYGGVNNDDHEWMWEGSLGLLVSRQLAIGFEYRQKPDNLNLSEEDWRDIFITYIPNKHFNVTLAWAELGSIAGSQSQQGMYLSLTGYLW